MEEAQQCAVCGQPMDPKQWGNFHVQNKVTKEVKHAHADCIEREPQKAKEVGFLGTKRVGVGVPVPKVDGGGSRAR